VWCALADYALLRREGRDAAQPACTQSCILSADGGAHNECFWQLLSIAAIACVTLVAAPLLVSMSRSGEQAVEMQQKQAATHAKGARFEQLSTNLLSGLEREMDSSVDTKVHAFMKTPAAAKSEQLMQMDGGMPRAPMPAIGGYHRLLPFDPHPFVSDTQLDRLLSEKRELQRKREAILRTLRMRRQAAAARAAKDATELDKIRLERAVAAAKQRQLEHAERAARAAASKMREAAIAKQEAMHAAEVAATRQRELEYMDAISHARAVHAARQDAVSSRSKSVCICV
jgi:hypothetical protein